MMNELDIKSLEELPQVPSDKARIQKALLNPLYTFENFVAGDSNNLAFMAAKSISSNLKMLYNPLFIQGGIGVGKTHLLHAIGNIMQEQGKKVVYTSVEDFLSDFIKHLSNQTMDRFKLKYRICDLLLIDDIQFLSGKDSLQEEVFLTIEALSANNRQIVIASDKPPKLIGGLSDRLKSRFVCGLVVTIEPLELETKIEIIKKKSETNSLHLDAETIHYIASVTNNTFEIEGIITKLNAYPEIMVVDITIEYVRNLLESYLV